MGPAIREPAALGGDRLSDETACRAPVLGGHEGGQGLPEDTAASGSRGYLRARKQASVEKVQGLMAIPRNCSTMGAVREGKSTRRHGASEEARQAFSRPGKREAKARLGRTGDQNQRS